MKKLVKFLSLMILFVCSLCLVACNDRPVEEPTNPLKEAAGLVKAMYINDTTHTSSYELVSVVRVDGVAYEVVWTIAHNSGSAEMVDVVAPTEPNGPYVVSYNDEITEDTAYVLTATIKDSENNTETVVFKERVATVVPPKTAAQFVNLKDGVAAKAAGYVVNIIYNGYYIQDETGRILVYKPEATPELGQYVTVKGSKGTYSGAHQFAAGSTFTVDESKGTLTQEQINEKLAAEVMPNVKAALDVDKASNINKTMVISGVVSINADNNHYYDITDATGTLTIANVNNDYSSQLKNQIGKNVTLTVSVYSNSAYTFVINSVTEKALTDAETVALAKGTLLESVANYDGFSSLDNEVVGCSVSYAETTDPVTGLVSADGTVKASASDTVVKLTATITKGEVTETVKLEITVKALEVMSVSDACSKKNDETIKVKGVVVNIIYNAFYVADESGIIMVYKPATTPELGQTVTVTGTKGSYNDAHQFATGANVVVDETVAVKTAEEIATVLNAAVVSDLSTVVASTESINKCYTITGTLSVSGYNYTITSGESKVTFGNVADSYKPALAAAKGLEVTLTVMGYNSKTLTYVCGSVVMPELSDADKVALAKEYISSYNWDGKSELPTEYRGVTIAWSGSDAVSADGKVTLGEAAVEVTLTATLTLGEATDTATVTGTIPALPKSDAPLSAPVKLDASVEGSCSGQNKDLKEGASLGNGIVASEVSKIYGATGKDMLLADGTTAAPALSGLKFGSSSVNGSVTLTGFAGYFNQVTFLAASWENNKATTFTLTATCTDGTTVVKEVSVTSTTAKALLETPFVVSFEKEVASIVISATNRGFLSEVEFSYVAPQA